MAANTRELFLVKLKVDSLEGSLDPFHADYRLDRARPNE